MTLFKNDTHRDVWRQRWCETCFQPDEAARRIQGKDTQCPIWGQAMRTDRKPVAWDRNTRSEEMERSIKCNEYHSRPTIANIRRMAYEDVPLFDVDETQQVSLIPVEGWPEKPTKDGVDHQ